MTCDAACDIIVDEVITRLHGLVVNQSRYVFPIDTGLDFDRMYSVSDSCMTDEKALEFLVGKSIISDEKLTKLAAKAGVRVIFSGDEWVDPVADYIVANQDDCEDLWKHIESLIEA